MPFGEVVSWQLGNSSVIVAGCMLHERDMFRTLATFTWEIMWSGTAVERHPYTALQSLKGCESVEHAPLICVEAYYLRSNLPYCFCQISMCSSVRSTRHCLESKIPNHLQVQGFHLWSCSRPYLAHGMQIYGPVGDADCGPFLCYGKYSTVFNLICSPKVSSSKWHYVRNLKMAIPHVPNRNITALGAYKFVSCSCSLYISCPTMWWGRSVLLQFNIASNYPIKSSSLLIASDFV